MKVSAFDFELPAERIAQAPLPERDAARLLIVKQKSLEDRKIRDLPSLFSPGDLLIFNNSKVIPARLFGTLNEKIIEIFLLRALTPTRWQAFGKPGKKLKAGTKISFNKFFATIEEKNPDGTLIIAFAMPENKFSDFLKQHGHIPLPPYIKREDSAADVTRYQTIYAAEEGSVAAPTAGLHFTETLLAALKAKQIETDYVTLHVGAGTFQPVKVEDTNDHKMHSEFGIVTKETAQKINETKKRGGKIIAVGTTSLRLLESATDEKNHVMPFSGDTDIFITPGYRFKTVDALLTNFHLPKSTLFMLVCAFAGTERMQEAYQHAIAENYRFYSYGDACLLMKNA